VAISADVWACRHLLLRQRSCSGYAYCISIHIHFFAVALISSSILHLVENVVLLDFPICHMRTVKLHNFSDLLKMRQVSA
jgi:hypothetical protein